MNRTTATAIAFGDEAAAEAATDRDSTTEEPITRWRRIAAQKGKGERREEKE